MPLENYFTPENFKSNGGYTPGAGLAGFLSADEYAKQQQARELQLQLVQDALHRQQAETTNYDLDYGERAAERGAKTSDFTLRQGISDTAMQTPGYLQDIVGGQRGEAQSKNAAGREAMGTVQGKIDVANSQSEVTKLENLARQLELTAASSPMMAQSQWQQIYKTMPPQLRTQFSDTYTPDVQVGLKRLMDVVKNNPAHRREMEKTESQNASQERIGAGNNAATVEAARYRATAHVKDLFDQFQTAKTPEQMLFIGNMIMNSEDADEKTKAMVHKGMESAARTLAQRNSKGQIDFNDPTGGSGKIEDDYFTRLLGGPPQSESPQQMTIPGVGQVQVLGRNPDGSVKFRAPNGRTGTYKP